MKAENNTKQAYRWILSALVGVVLISALNSCASKWFLTPREKSIKEWEDKHNSVEEKKSDSLQKTERTSTHDVRFKILNVTGS
ncbi:hypothetical protein [Costertonia aggregata]|uniref:Uncharacterized protein n=1 Tax=Costertonia aggregata TaxID=343403 RepID=A0A7H9ALR0_9FLAO|nr:hypothetical protein [Costertonia aggregata]QLG44379.1 hypothetical protein HYG79_03135 [Costertonia aggregata]